MPMDWHGKTKRKKPEQCFDRKVSTKCISCRDIFHRNTNRMDFSPAGSFVVEFLVRGLDFNMYMTSTRD